MSAHTVPMFYDDLTASYGEAWRLLVRGVNDRRSAFHTPAVATVDPAGYPKVRTVVLRGADPSDGSLRFHTDKRASKVTDIAGQPKVSLHFYEKKAKIQLRLSGFATCHVDGPVKEAAWAASQDMSRECYRVDRGPGSIVSAANEWSIPHDVDDPDMGKDNFVAVSIAVQSIEWLYLARGGHRRARFHVGPQGTLAQGEWLVP
ncbi:MAG: pyridoxamine 5'-phosphate oxidase family protein [Pseudomonadota bacterium]